MLKVINLIQIRSVRGIKFFTRQNFNLTDQRFNTIKCTRLFNTSNCTFEKLFKQDENDYAHKLLPRFPIPSAINKIDTCVNKVQNDEDFEIISKKLWRNSTATVIVQTFNSLVDYCILNNINLADERFNNLVDGLLDNVENLTYEEIVDILTCLSKYPRTDAVTSHNFHDVWTALDDICCWHTRNWNIDQLFELANLWYKLGLGRKSNFIYKVIDKYITKVDKLTKEQLVLMFFYMNVSRRNPVAFAYEHALQHHIKDMNVDEMAIVAMGYFKSKSKIKTAYIIESMLDIIKNESKTIHEISLCALLKILRYSTIPTIASKMYELLECITPEISRLSLTCCLHISLLGTTLMIFHEESLRKVAQKFHRNISNVEKVRLKDMERILLALAMFDYNPNTKPDIFNSIKEELYKTSRAMEIELYPKAFVCALTFLSLRNIYPMDLISKVLDENYINTVYGKKRRNVPRELFTLDLSLEIECSNYNGNRLKPVTRYRSAKWLTDFTPREGYKRLTATDKLMMDVTKTVADLVGGSQNIYVQHVLPHFAKSDIVLCMEKQTKQFVDPKSNFIDYTLGDVMKPGDTNKFDWFAVVVLGWNLTIRETSSPVGLLNMKKRQLIKIGYKPIFVVWHEYNNLTPQEKCKYILHKIQEL